MGFKFWDDEWVHLVHVGACPHGPAANGSEQSQSVSEASVGAGLALVLGPHAHILAQEDCKHNEDYSKHSGSVNESVLFLAHFYSKRFNVLRKINY